MAERETIVIVGGGLAAGKAAEELRVAGFEGRVFLFAREPHLPYELPPLSKGYLLGKDELDAVFVHPPGWYDENQIEVSMGTPVRALDLARHVVSFDGGEQAYDRLLLATGAKPRELPAGLVAPDARVATLRTISDSQRLKSEFREGRRIVFVGGGWIGLEAAAAATELGADVTVLEALDLPLIRVLGSQVANVFADVHRERGVRLRTKVQVQGIGRDSVTLAGGERIPADLVVIAIGVRPDTELADGAGLAVDDGVLTDATLATSDPDVYAAGDVANHDHPALGRIRVEHWATAVEQGKVGARNLLGQEESYDRLPYFFTDQYDLGMEFVGATPAGDGATTDEPLLRGDVTGRLFTAWWLRGHGERRRVVAGMHVNDWEAIRDIRRIVGREVDVRALLEDPLGDV